MKGTWRVRQGANARFQRLRGSSDCAVQAAWFTEEKNKKKWKHDRQVEQPRAAMGHLTQSGTITPGKITPGNHAGSIRPICSRGDLSSQSRTTTRARCNAKKAPPAFCENFTAGTRTLGQPKRSKSTTRKETSKRKESKIIDLARGAPPARMLVTFAPS